MLCSQKKARFSSWSHPAAAFYHGRVIPSLLSVSQFPTESSQKLEMRGDRGLTQLTSCAKTMLKSRWLRLSLQWDSDSPGKNQGLSALSETCSPWG